MPLISSFDLVFSENSEKIDFQFSLEPRLFRGVQASSAFEFRTLRVVERPDALKSNLGSKSFFLRIKMQNLKQISLGRQPTRHRPLEQRTLSAESTL